MNDYILVNTSIAPDAFNKVIEAKRLLAEGKAKNTGDAIEKVKISRSAYYKYKDFIFDFNEVSLEHIFTLFFELDDVSGVLSDILTEIAESGCNVLTINQSIPINNMANVIISSRIGNGLSIEGIIEKLKGLNGVKKVKLLSVQ